MSNTLGTLGQLYEMAAGIGIQEETVVSFDGGSAGDPGNLATTPYKLFLVKGLVQATVYALVENDVASSGSGTLKLGIGRESHAGGGLDTTASLIASTTASQLNTDEIWFGATPQATLAASTIANFPANIISKDIILTVGTANIDSGRIRFVCLWKPLTKNASVTARPGGAVVSPSSSPSPSASASPSASTSPSPSVSASISPSASASSSASLSQSPSASNSPSSSASTSSSSSQSPSASGSPSASASASISPSSSQSPSASRSPSASISQSPSLSISPSASVSPSHSLSPSASISASPSPSA